MKSVIVTILIPALALASAVPATVHRRQVSSDPCQQDVDGPGLEGMDAVFEFMKKDLIKGGDVCLPGEDGITGQNKGTWCGVCKGAYIGYQNMHADGPIGRPCVNEDDFNKALDEIREWAPNGRRCQVEVKGDDYLSLIYGRPEDFDNGGEQPCKNLC